MGYLRAESGSPDGDLGGPRTAALLNRLDQALDRAVVFKPIAAITECRRRLVNATIIEHSRGFMRDNVSSTPDPEAGFTTRGGRTYHWYKDHITVCRSGLVVDSRFSDAASHDSHFIDERTRNEKWMVAADSTCRGRERQAARDAQSRSGGRRDGRTCRRCSSVSTG